MKTRNTRNIAIILAAALAAASLAACGGQSNNSAGSSAGSSASSAVSEAAETAASAATESAVSEAASVSESTASSAAESAASEVAINPDAPTTDREGNPIAIPAEVSRVVSLAPATMQILDSVGARDMVVGIDTQTPMYVEGTDSLPQFDMMEPDIEQIAALEPDIVFTTGMSYIEGDPYSALLDLGICVVVIPSSNSIEGIKEDILFTADCVGKKAEAEPIVADLQAQIDEVASIGETITDKKTVLFEISALPYIYSFGKDTFLDEMITIIGAENVFADQESWISVTEEDAVAADPDVILTSVNYIDDPIGEIKGRAGWENVKAIANDEVYYIDNSSSSLPSQYIVKALYEMAEAVYPEVYAELAEAA